MNSIVQAEKSGQRGSNTDAAKKVGSNRTRNWVATVRSVPATANAPVRLLFFVFSHAFRSIFSESILPVFFTSNYLSFLLLSKSILKCVKEQCVLNEMITE